MHIPVHMHVHNFTIPSRHSIKLDLVELCFCYCIIRMSLQANRQHVTPEVLEIFLRLTQYLVALPTGSVILKHLFDHILFNPALWIHASVEV